MTNKKYNYSGIRQEFDLAFDDSELNAFCLDYFPDVYDKFTGGMRKDDKITLLLDYCRRRGTGFETLLKNVREEYTEKAEPGKTSNLENLHLKPLIKALEGTKNERESQKETNHSSPTQQEPNVPTYPFWIIAAGSVIILLLGIFLGPILMPRTPEDAAITPPTSPLSTIPPPTSPSTTISDKDGMILLYVPEGEFQMGSGEHDPLAYYDEKPRHKVYLDAFWIDETEITNAMFIRFVEETGHQSQAEQEGFGWLWSGSDWLKVEGASWRHPQGPESNITELESHPVVQVSWNDASTYCQWVGRRLPTEAEWEKAAGGTDGRKWPWGNETPNDSLANFNYNAEGTTSVGSYSVGASPYGALDMAGNAWEWVNDNYASDYYKGDFDQNPQEPTSSSTKVLRGGSWTNRARDIRARNRQMFKADERGEGGGFRCAISAE